MITNLWWSSFLLACTTTFITLFFNLLPYDPFLIFALAFPGWLVILLGLILGEEALRRINPPNDSPDNQEDEP